MEDIFEVDAFDAIRTRLTLAARNGREPVHMHYPLVVNNMAVRCMNLTAEIGAPRVNAEIVLEA